MKKRGTVRSLSFRLFSRPGKAEGHAHHGGKADEDDGVEDRKSTRLNSSHIA